VKRYDKDTHFRKVREMLQDEKQTADDRPAVLPYDLEHDGLIYSVDRTQPDGPRRLCIPKGMVKEILSLAHDQMGHGGVKTLISRLNALAIHRVAKQARDYVAHCDDCLKHETRRDKPFGNCQPILTPDIIFHTITIDFILALPVAPDGDDCIMTVACKTSKAKLFIPGKTTWTAEK
jgi:hypothetical protein